MGKYGTVYDLVRRGGAGLVSMLSYNNNLTYKVHRVHVYFLLYASSVLTIGNMYTVIRAAIELTLKRSIRVTVLHEVLR
jgi:hypothetical protein